MIKKFTPSKEFFRPKRETSCCKFFFNEERKQENCIDISPKILPSRTPETPSRSFQNHEQDISNVSNNSFKTPRTSFHPSCVKSTNKTLMLTATTLEYSSGVEPFTDLKSIQLNLNPLARLKKRLCRNSTTPNRTEQSFIHPHRITFSYISSSGQSNPSRQSSQIDLQFSKSMQLQEQLENDLQKEIEVYRQEYKQLLDEFQRLQKEKDENREKYATLLENIQKKEEEIRELERLRREQITLLREELQNYIEEQLNIQ